MWVSIEQIKKGVTAFYESEMASKATGAGKFAAYFILPSVPGIIQKKFDEIKNMPIMDGIINADGLIELDEARDRAEKAMSKCGSVELMGFRINIEDVETLADMIRKA